jgi:hypothetical protein
LDTSEKISNPLSESNAYATLAMALAANAINVLFNLLVFVSMTMMSFL